MYDYIVVGQGLAGTVLAHTLLQENKNIFIINQESTKCPSAVAAGIYNPITGKRMVQTWKASLLFPFLENFYGNLEKLLDASFLHKMPVYKPFSSFAEQNHFISTQMNGEEFYTISSRDQQYNAFIINELGGFETKYSGNVDVSLLMDASRKYFQDLGIYQSSPFQYHDVVMEEECVRWKGLKAKKILFCEGPKSTENPFFNWLPFVLAKGELLQVSLPAMPEDVIFNKSVFLLPVGDALYKVGATYEWNFTDNEISEAGRTFITSKLDALLKIPYTVTGQVCAIRPTVKDRRPLIGLHPQFKTLGIFNGLGTKGVSLAPFFARHFLNFLENDQNLDSEVNIERFYSLL